MAANSTFRLRHDQLVKKAFENPLVAKEFFDQHLPEDVKKLLDIDSMRLEKDTFVDESIKDSASDILFSAKFDNQDGFLFLLLEHQSKPHSLMAFRLFKYMINILDQYLTKNPKAQKLPLIYPIIFYNGKQQYNVSRNLWGLFTYPELAKQFWANDYQLVNVHRIPDNELKEKIWAGTLQFFMKHIWQRDAINIWEEIQDLLPKLAKMEIGHNYIRLLLTYSLTKIKESDKIKLENIITNTLGTQGEDIVASLAKKWYYEGVTEGEARGEARGETKAASRIALNLLKQNLDINTIASITGLSIEQLLKLKNHNRF